MKEAAKHYNFVLSFCKVTFDKWKCFEECKVYFVKPHTGLHLSLGVGFTFAHEQQKQERDIGTITSKPSYLRLN